MESDNENEDYAEDTAMDPRKLAMASVSAKLSVVKFARGSENVVADAADTDASDYEGDESLDEKDEELEERETYPEEGLYQIQAQVVSLMQAMSRDREKDEQEGAKKSKEPAPDPSENVEPKESSIKRKMRRSTLGSFIRVRICVPAVRGTGCCKSSPGTRRWG